MDLLTPRSVVWCVRFEVKAQI